LALKAISFDVWNTLLKIGPFFKVIASELSLLAGLKEEAVEDIIWKVYGRIKELRRGGLINDEEIVGECLTILSNELGISQHVIRRAVARALLSERLGQLIIPGAFDTLKELKNMGFKLATLGNVIFWPGSYNRLILEKVGLGDYLPVQVYADEIKCSKPKGRAFLTLAKELGVKPGEILHVGDSFYEDFLGALQAGFKAALIDPNGPPSEFRGIAYVIRDVKELRELVSRGNLNGKIL